MAEGDSERRKSRSRSPRDTLVRSQESAMLWARIRDQQRRLEGLEATIRRFKIIIRAHDDLLIMLAANTCNCHDADRSESMEGIVANTLAAVEDSMEGPVNR